MREGYLAFLGSRAEEVIRSYHVDKAVFSCKALNQESGIMESQEAFAFAKKAMRAAAHTTILVADNSKFDQTAFSIAGEIHGLDTVVTDIRPEERWIRYFEEVNVRCRYPGQNEADR